MSTSVGVDRRLPPREAEPPGEIVLVAAEKQKLAAKVNAGHQTSFGFLQLCQECIYGRTFGSIAVRSKKQNVLDPPLRIQVSKGTAPRKNNALRDLFMLSSASR